MKRIITLFSIIGLAALNSACAEETDTAKNPPVTVVNNMNDTIKDENLVIAKNTARKNATVKETGSTRTVVYLMATPFRDAKQTGQLPANAAIEILERRGGWLQISGKGAVGWVRLHQVRTGDGAPATKSGEGISMLKSVGKTGRSGSQGIVATTGIRGLSAEELKSAKPNPKAVQSLESSRASDSAARAFASSGGLKERDVPFFGKQ